MNAGVEVSREHDAGVEGSSELLMFMFPHLTDNDLLMFPQLTANHVPTADSR
jgi:hypothetical protein